MCGKNPPQASADAVLLGSPPRVREELRPAGMVGEKSGITPACAGRTERVDENNSLRQDHPRVCGKNYAPNAYRASCEGSPPRVREERLGLQATRSGPRITPACAGRTCAGHCKRLPGRDHPRVCGKNYLMAV